MNKQLKKLFLWPIKLLILWWFRGVPHGGALLSGVLLSVVLSGCSFLITPEVKLKAQRLYITQVNGDYHHLLYHNLIQLFHTTAIPEPITARLTVNLSIIQNNTGLDKNNAFANKLHSVKAKVTLVQKGKPLQTFTVMRMCESTLLGNSTLVDQEATNTLIKCIQLLSYAIRTATYARLS